MVCIVDAILADPLYKLKHFDFPTNDLCDSRFLVENMICIHLSYYSVNFKHYLDAEGRVSNSTRTILYILLGIFALILIAALVYCIVIRKSKKNEIKDP
ncbi:hypothetical protein Smp_032690 [Schistosoma mansoni]|uniref:hypothetical protein n=1 Tax=Schistosoma mansoni TaxID=6183 RepID=UPI0001A63600|nr:hypothetical protein Smp_032690 [Schistosoma mansoni]|eukprot:XP_018649583.1 hypothetical protein Smp_032690 [Schistosoma mansoni]